LKKIPRNLFTAPPLATTSASKPDNGPAGGGGGEGKRRSRRKRSRERRSWSWIRERRS